MLHASRRPGFFCATVSVVGLLLVAGSARAELTGNMPRGQYGLTAGTQIPTGLAVAPLLYNFHPTSVVDASGDSVPSSGSFNTLAAPALNVWWVSPWKILGGSYGAALILWGTAPMADFPKIGLATTSYGLGDAYLKPFELGWHTAHVDTITGVAFYVPTGRYTPGASDNTGEGQWGAQLSGGATVWFDHERHINAATLAFVDVYAPKSAKVDASNVRLRTGNIFGLQGGVGYQFWRGAFNVGIPYFGEWKLSADTLPPGASKVLPGISAAKSWSVGTGLEGGFYWGQSSAVVLRWLQGVAGSNTTLGSTVFLTFSYVFAFATR
jgi:hypothetical protein